MAKGNQIANVIRRELLNLEQMQAAVAVLDEFGSFENARDEMKREFVDAQIRRDDVKQECEQIIEEIIKAKAEYAEYIEKSKESLNQEREVQKAEIKDLVLKGQAQAEKLIEQAKTRSEEELSKHQAELISLKSNKAQISTEINKLIAERDGVNSHIQKMKRFLNNLQQQAAEMSRLKASE